jgi:hypothetical protein
MLVKIAVHRTEVVATTLQQWEMKSHLGYFENAAWLGIFQQAHFQVCTFLSAPVRQVRTIAAMPASSSSA